MRVTVRQMLVVAMFVACATRAHAQSPAISCPNSPEWPAPMVETCVFTGQACAGPYTDTWSRGCNCENNSLFRRECLSYAQGGCSTHWADDNYCGRGCQYKYPLNHSDLCLPVEVPPCPDCDRVGQPVSVTTGDMFFTHTDAIVGELAVARTFSSGRVADSSRYGAFGPGWNATFESRLVVISPKTLAARLHDGAPQYYFDDELDGTYASELPYSTETTIETTPSGHRRVFRAGGDEVYDSAGRIVSVTDAAGIATSYARDGQGRLTSMTRRGRSIAITYSGASSQPYQLIGPAQAVLATYGYDASNRLETVTYADGSGFHYFYDAGGRIVRVQDGAGKTVEEHAYDGQGRAVTSQIAEGVNGLTLAYGSNQTVVTDSLGRTTTYMFEKVRGIPRLTKVTGPCPSCGAEAGESQEWTYDALGRITSIKNADGKLTTYTYDSDGSPLTETDPLTHTTTYTYDAEGRVLTVTAPDTGVTTTTYGPPGPLSVTDPLTRSTTFTYNAQGKPDTITDARGKTTTLTYDSATADLLSIIDPLTHPTTYGYDAFGRRTTVTDALNHTTTTTYDARGRVTRVTSPDGTYTRFTYDASGQRTEVIDPLGRTTRYVYDKFGRLETVVDAANGLTNYGYDLMSNLVALTDARGQTTRFDYDSFNRVSTVRYPGGGSEVFTYDSVGRLKTKTDRKSVMTTFSYDDAGHLVGKSYSDGVTPAVAFTYDAVGRMLTAANGTDTLTWVYNLAGEMTSEQSNRNASTVAYTYDDGGNRLSVSLDGTLLLGYAYDDASRLTGITRGSSLFSFGYDAANRRTTLGYPNGITTSYAYDMNSRVTTLGASLGATVITSFGYGYDAADNRTSKTTPDLTESYGYDGLYRLTQVGRTGSPTDQSFYSYDPVGNRLTTQIGQAVTRSIHDAGNRLLSTVGGGPLRIRGHLDEPGTATVNGQQARMLPGNVFDATINAAPGANTVTVTATDLGGNVTTKSWTANVPAASGSYSYDPNGNLAQRFDGTDTWTYEWNAENELKRVVKNGVEQARFAYDPNGRRVTKVAAGVTTDWTYAGEDMLRETRGATTLKYVHGPGIDEPLAIDDGSGLTYLHADGLGSVVAMTNAAGAVSLVRRYDAWGNLESGAATDGYAFTGREWDSETGLYYYRARYYDPTLGRFISEDPLGFIAGTNFHEYVGSNPVVYGDPFGLQTTTSNWGPNSPFCEAIRRAIQKAMSQLLRMRLERAWPRFTLSEEELQNHIDSYDAMRRNLRKNLRKFRKANCGDPPPGAPEACRRPYPTPEFEPVYPFGPPKQSQRPEQAAAAAAFAQTLLIIAIMIALAPVGL